MGEQERWFVWVCPVHGHTDAPGISCDHDLTRVECLPLDDPALRDAVNALEIIDATGDPYHSGVAHRAYLLLTTAFPSLASPKTGAE